MTGGPERSSNFNPCAITQKYFLVPIELTLVTEARTSTRHWAYLEHGKYISLVRDTRKVSIPGSVVEASTQMSLSSFAVQSDTYNKNYNLN